MEDRSGTPARNDAAQAKPTLDVRTAAAPVRMVTARSVGLGLLLMPLNAYWVTRMEVVRYLGHPTTISLFFNVVFFLAVLIGLNAIARRISPRIALEPAELLTVYIMLAIGSALTGHDMIEVLTPIMAHAQYYKTPANNWATLILPHIPRWLSVTDTVAVEGFYIGTGSFYHWKYVSAWLVPVLSWTGFLSLLGFMMLCINTLLRRQWTESERLSYPLVALPVEMVSPRTQLFGTRLFWAGALLAVALETWNGLAFLYPSMPMLPLKRSGAAQDIIFTSPPWNAMGSITFAFYPFGVALGMLLPVDLLFSTWFFYWFWKFQNVFGAVSGYAEIPDFPFTNAQSFGAYIGLAVFALAVSRHHFIAIWRDMFRRVKTIDDSKEPLPYRWAVIGLGAGTVAVMWFCLACGMSVPIIIAFFAIYFTLAIAITRMRAELGPPAHDLHYAGPDTILPNVLGTSGLQRGDMTMFSMFWGFNRAYRSHPMPIQLEAFKMAERSGAKYRPLFWVMMLAIVFGCLCGFWAMLDQNYRLGAAENIAPPNVNLIFGGEPWNRMAGWINTPTPPQHQFYTRVAIGFGFLFALLLNALRLRIAWFPFHPVGYAVSSSWSMWLLWLSMAIAWVIKLCLLRYGGLRAYRQALPLFLGIILGECVLGSVWTLVGIAFNIPTYAFWP